MFPLLGQSTLAASCMLPSWIPLWKRSPVLPSIQSPSHAVSVCTLLPALLVLHVTHFHLYASHFYLLKCPRSHCISDSHFPSRIFSTELESWLCLQNRWSRNLDSWMSIRNEESCKTRALCGEPGQWDFKFSCCHLSRCLKGFWGEVPGTGLHSHLQQEYLLFHLFQVKKSLVTFIVVVTYTIEQRLVDYGLRVTSGSKLKTVFVNEVS